MRRISPGFGGKRAGKDKCIEGNYVDDNLETCDRVHGRVRRPGHIRVTPGLTVIEYLYFGLGLTIFVIAAYIWMAEYRHPCYTVSECGEKLD